MKKIAFSLVLVFSCVFVQAQIPTTSLVAWWPFNGNANDATGNGSNGTVSGATLTADRFGNPNSAYSFDGISAKITIGTNGFVDALNTDNLTVAFWEKTYSSPNNDAQMICKNTYGSWSGYAFGSNGTDQGYCNGPGTLNFYTAASTMGDACANNAITTGTNLNTWFFIVGVYDGATATASIYVNGVLQNDIGARDPSGSLSASSTNLVFGAHPSNLGFFKGALDDIRIYKTKLSSSQIAALYNECVGVQQPPVSVTNPTNQVVCSGKSATLSVTAAGLVNWYSSSTSTVVLSSSTVFVTPALSAGSPTFYVEDGCTYTSTPIRVPITLTVNSSPTISVNSGTVCAGQSFTLSATGASTYNYPGSNPVVTPVSNPSSYTVTGTATGGCSNTAVAQITVMALPVLSVNSGTICSGQSFQISPAGASGFTISGNNFNVSPAVTSTYLVNGVTGGCSGTPVISTVQVNPTPTLSVAGGTICAGGSFTFTPSGAVSYSISGGSMQVTPAVTTSYTISGGNAFGCTDSKTVSVVVTTSPSIFVSGNNFVCAGSPLSLIASGSASTYSWSTGTNGNFLTVSPLVSTTYTVFGSIGNCSTSLGFPVTVHPLPVIAFSNGTICLGSSFLLSPSGAVNYTYSSVFPQVTPAVTTSYSVIGVDANGCTGTASNTVLVFPLPLITASSSNPSEICAGETAILTASGAQTFTWNGTATGAVYSVQPSATTVYTVFGTDANGCTAGTTIPQLVAICLGVDQHSGTELSLKVFPNPNNGEFTVSLNTPAEIRVLNALGQLVKTQKLSSGQNAIDMNGEPSGLYILNVSLNGKSASLRVVKQ